MIEVYRGSDYFEAQLLKGLMEQDGLQVFLHDVVSFYSLFRDVLLPISEKPQLRIPSKLKKSVEDARTANVTRLKEEQKAVGSIWNFLKISHWFIDF